MESGSERRLKAAYISEHDVLQLFLFEETGFPLGDIGSISIFRRYRIIGVPVGTKVVRAHYEPGRAAWWVALQHSSFDVVPMGEAPPILPIEVREIFVDSSGKVISQSDSWRDKPAML